MYNHYIDSFLCVAQNSSINRAAEILYISATALQNQMKSLEKKLGVSLFKRSSRGVELTENGQAFLWECHRLIDTSEDVIRNTRHPLQAEKAPIRLGTSVLSPTEGFIRLCQSHPELRKYRIQIVSVPAGINSIVPVKVQNPDLFEIGFAAEPSIESFTETDFVPFARYELCCAVPMTHPLAHKAVLTLPDLEGEVLCFPSRGNPGLTHDFTDALRRECTGIKVVSPPIFYDFDLLNTCAEEGRILVSPASLKNIHPGLVHVPVEWDWFMPYGLIWKKDARKEVLEFTAAFRKVVQGQ